MAETVGFGIEATALRADCRCPERSTMSACDICSISTMSAPAAKTRSPPYTTTARTSLRLPASLAAARISSCTATDRAFILGRSMRRVPTPSATSRRA
jgi:hypothetical protein